MTQSSLVYGAKLRWVANRSSSTVSFFVLYIEKESYKSDINKEVEYLQDGFPGCYRFFVWLYQIFVKFDSIHYLEIL